MDYLVNKTKTYILHIWNLYYYIKLPHKLTRLQTIYVITFDIVSYVTS